VPANPHSARIGPLTLRNMGFYLRRSPGTASPVLGCNHVLSCYPHRVEFDAFKVSDTREEAALLVFCSSIHRGRDLLQSTHISLWGRFSHARLIGRGVLGVFYSCQCNTSLFGLSQWKFSKSSWGGGVALLMSLSRWLVEGGGGGGLKLF